MKFSRIFLLFLLIPCLTSGQTFGNNSNEKKRYKRAVTHRYNWTGFYGGVNGGYGLVDASTQFNPLPDATTFIDLMPTTLNPNTTSGFIGGGQIGCNFQIKEWVLGIEADFQTGPAANISQSPIVQDDGNVFPGAGFLQTTERAAWFGTVRPRFGFTPLGRLLVYLTGGLAYGSVNYSATTDFRPAGTNYYSASYDAIKLGWTAGMGTEWVLDRNLSLKAEDIYYDLGDESAIADAGPTPDPPYQVAYHWETKANVFRVGLNYKFF